MNDFARTIMRDAGVPVWEEPALLTSRAPGASFHDAIHLDVCHWVFERFAGPSRMYLYNSCVARRERGQRAAEEPLLQNASGFHAGVNEEIVQGLFTLLGCQCELANENMNENPI